MDINDIRMDLADRDPTQMPFPPMKRVREKDAAPFKVAPLADSIDASTKPSSAPSHTISKGKRRKSARNLERTTKQDMPDDEQPESHFSVPVIIPKHVPLADTPIPPSFDLAKRQRKSLHRHTFQSTYAQTTDDYISPELTELITHRENIVREETRQLQAFIIADRENIAREETRHLQAFTVTDRENIAREETRQTQAFTVTDRENIAREETRRLQAFIVTDRENIAREETRQLQTFVAPPKQEEGRSSSAEPATKAEPEKQKQVAHGLFRRRHKVPILHQISMVECGAACLAMLLSYHGRKTTVSEVREQCGVGRDGLSALSIVKSARKYGMRVRAVSLEENDFRFVTLPAIVHWEFNHFIVVEHWSPKSVDVVDPALGRKRMSAKEFDEGFTGVVIMMEPGVQFSHVGKISSLSLRSYAKSYIQQAPLSVIQVLGASLLLQVLGLIFPLLSAVAINDLIPMRMSSALEFFGLGMIMIVLALTVIRLLRSMILLYLQARVDSSLMFGFLERLFSLPQRFFLQRSTGDILARVSSNTVIRDTISNQLFSTVLDGSFVLIYFFILLSQSPSFTLVIVVIGLLQAILLLGTGKRLTELNRRELVAVGKLQGYLTETLAGIKTIKSAGAEHRILERWSNLFFEQMNISVRRIYLSSVIDTVLSTLSTFAPLILLWLGVQQVIDGSMQLGTMLALSALGSSLLTPITSLIASGRQIQLVQSHMERLADVIEAEPEQDILVVTQPPELSGQIQMEHVSFQYDPQSPAVLRDINVNISQGQKIAIVGRTGSGKSTLGGLLLGLYTPTKGEVYYDHIPLKKLNYQAVRSQFGVVMQEANVFSGSIRENITLNDPGMNMEQVIRAAQLAAIHDDIMKMPMEYETMVSEGGSALSGGQRQRLALARAIVNAPAVLLLDEATSSLDVVTEKVVEQNIRQLACTQIIIAHRLSTVRNADVILVLHEGQMVERGTHEELIQRNGYYARLIHHQLANGELVSR